MKQWLKGIIDITEINHSLREVHYIYGIDFLINFHSNFYQILSK